MLPYRPPLRGRGWHLPLARTMPAYLNPVAERLTWLEPQATPDEIPRHGDSARQKWHRLSKRT